ncbi:hypothetical protein LPJ78_004212 [Coemansia sp. RSA 989]|nr:hypothetical protein LPJ68_003465 [Coemansia sp. RSA 1086]KAJ1749109.1 hypothetical protein LPJ79_003987 [Coemansia sp. RSA 1821]KAJ1863194.1 hypothetical protein LPJ78_004212 [Coemansia sp. RSA 989]KAJ1870985.1 hypothetical protein LPJ55_004242 [Coemansia sp. RSA 990]KAJ2630162.1 hypothetical protein H4R22_002861 [Coemansia sp. RSA 1290]KAJ2646664.1 hypothetical protein IWW40_005252 [Coemansia sp. RSA 1250]
MSQLYSASQSARGLGASGSQVQVQSQLHGLRAYIQSINDIAEDTIRVCTVAGLDLEELGETDSIGKIDKAMRQLIDAQHCMDVESSLISQLTQSDTSAIETEYLSSWEQSMSKYEGMSDASKYGRNEKYRDFRQQLWDVSHEGQPMPRLFADQAEDESDEELVIAGARLTYRCPVTTSWLVDPVTSKVCKHSFSKEAILSFIQSNRGSCACPVGGCSKTIRSRDLYADKLLERKVARHLRRLEMEETAAQYTVVQ